MEQARINNILSIQNLSSVNLHRPPPVNHHHHLQLQQLQHLQQFQQFQIQQQLEQLQQQRQELQQQQKPVPKKELIDLVTCKLCKGYLIDAATLDLCMHSFCRPCAVKYIREKPRCPECNLEIRDKRFLNRLKTDVTMQNIVYKLVPGLYEREMARRRKFYAARPSPTPRYKSEMFGDIPPSKTIKPDDMLNVCITWNKECLDEPIKMYLHCRADSTMLVLKKLIIRKFGLERPIQIYYGNLEIFFDLTTLMDVAATFNWAPENKILGLTFKEDQKEGTNLKSSGEPSSDP